MSPIVLVKRVMESSGFSSCLTMTSLFSFNSSNALSKSCSLGLFRPLRDRGDGVVSEAGGDDWNTGRTVVVDGLGVGDDW